MSNGQRIRIRLKAFDHRMPMRVMRADRKIASLRVVDVRQKICGAVVQEMDSKKERIKVGDRLQVDAQPDVSLK